MRSAILYSGFSRSRLCLVILMAGFAASVCAQGQGNPNPPGLEKKGKSLLNRTVLISRDEDSTKKGKNPEKPNRPENPPLGADVQNLVKEFKQQRETFLEQQKELGRQAKEESKEAREALREQNKELLEQIKEQQKLLRQEAKERAKELKKELHPDMGRVIDSGVGEGRER